MALLKGGAFLFACGLAASSLSGFANTCFAHDRPTEVARDYLVEACADGREHTGIYRAQDDMFIDLTAEQTNTIVSQDLNAFAHATRGEETLYVYHCHTIDKASAVLPSPLTRGGSDIAAAAYLEMREYLLSIIEQRPPRSFEFRLIATKRDRVVRYALNEGLQEKLYGLAQEGVEANLDADAKPLLYLVQDLTFSRDKKYKAYMQFSAAVLCSDFPEEVLSCPNLIPEYWIPEMNSANVLLITDEGPLFPE